MQRFTVMPRRTLLKSAGALLVASTLGFWSSRNNIPLFAAPVGQFLIERRNQSTTEHQLIATGSAIQPDHILATDVGSTFLSAALSPDQRMIAVLKRVVRGGLPIDIFSLYDRTTFQQIATTEVHMPFQGTPTWSLAWSADGSQLAAPYAITGRTLLFGIARQPTIGLQATLQRAAFQFHPQRANRALYEANPPGRTISIIDFDAHNQEQQIETIDGSDAQWSPDGSRLVYRANSGMGAAHGIILRDEHTRQTIRSFDLNVAGMAWSPNSRYLALLTMAHVDLLGLARLLPLTLIPGPNPAFPQPRLLIYDLATDQIRAIGALKEGFKLARLTWLDSDWLLVLATTVRNSYITDRIGQQHLTSLPLSDETPMLSWIAS